MPDQSPPAGRAPRLTPAEADRRKSLLALLQDALSAQRIATALVGRRTLVLCSDQTAEHFAGYGETVSPADPQLYVFAGGDAQIVTTDGEVYCFPDGHAHPAADPVGAARAYARRPHAADSRAVPPG
jgi:hypothetical protein